MSSRYKQLLGIASMIGLLQMSLFAYDQMTNIPASVSQHKLYAKIPEGSQLSITGQQYTDEGCQMTSVTITGKLEGTNDDDGNGYDEVTFELWDDGELKDSKTIKIKVGTVQDVTVTLSFNALYGTSAAGVGVEVNEVGFGEDPFYPEDISGQCGGSSLLTINKVGTGYGTVVSDPAGIDCGTDCSESYPDGTTVTLTAITDPGTIFSGWDGNCTEENETTCIVEVNGTISRVTARFDQSPEYLDGFAAGKQWCMDHPQECGILNGQTDIQTGWNLVGASCDVSTATLNQEEIITVWSWDRNQSYWQAWSPNEYYRNLLESSGIKILDHIPANHGFWISAGGNTTLNLCGSSTSAIPQE